jgi:hypothetical protein
MAEMMAEGERTNRLYVHQAERNSAGLLQWLAGRGVVGQSVLRADIVRFRAHWESVEVLHEVELTEIVGLRAAIQAMIAIYPNVSSVQICSELGATLHGAPGFARLSIEQFAIGAGLVLEETGSLVCFESDCLPIVELEEVDPDIALYGLHVI